MKSKFKVNDKVRVLREGLAGSDVNKDDILTVTYIHTSGCIETQEGWYFSILSQNGLELFHRKSHIRKPVKIVPKGWGQEIWVANNDKYCGKILEFDKGKGFSDHFHIKKTETFYVIKGFAKLTVRERDGKEYEYELSKGAIVDVAPGLMHKIVATSYFVMAEFSTTHDDEDSYRIKKGD